MSQYKMDEGKKVWQTELHSLNPPNGGDIRKANGALYGLHGASLVVETVES